MYDVIIQFELDMNIVLLVIPIVCQCYAMLGYLCYKLAQGIVLQQFKYDGL